MVDPDHIYQSGGTTVVTNGALSNQDITGRPCDSYCDETFFAEPE